MGLGFSFAAQDGADEISPAGNLIETVMESALALYERLYAQATSPQIFLQLAAVILALGLGWLLARPVRRALDQMFGARSVARVNGEGDVEASLNRFHQAFSSIATPLIAVALLWVVIAFFRASDLAFSVMRIAASLLSAWVVIRLVSAFVSDGFWSRTIAAVAWLAAALNILRLLDPTVAFLDGVVLPFGDDVSLFDALRAVVLAAILIWAASASSRVIQRRLGQTEKLTPSVRGLLGQLVRIGFIVGAAILALSVVGVDLTGFAVLTGAIGVGIGFGLQSIFQNFIAGIIILMEKTLKVGDFVDLESGITGEVKEINVRSTLVTTNDNVDILVPNAEFITNRVTNWTLREVNRRIRVPFGVAYGSDKELVKKAALEAAAEVPFTLTKNPKRAPQVWLVGFGDSSLDFELVVWLTDDAVRRPAAVTAAYNWALETALAKYELEIPFPQRDLHIIPPKEPKPKSPPKFVEE